MDELKHCYQCDTLAVLSPRSRCVYCEYGRCLVNEEENEQLRQQIDAHPSRGVVDEQEGYVAVITRHDRILLDGQYHSIDTVRASLQAAAPPADLGVYWCGEKITSTKRLVEVVKTECSKAWDDGHQAALPAVPVDPAAINPKPVDELCVSLQREAAAWESWNEEHPEDAAVTTLELLKQATDTITALARQLAEAKEDVKLWRRNEKEQMQRAIEAEAQLAQVTERLAAVEGLVRHLTNNPDFDFDAALQPKDD